MRLPIRCLSIAACIAGLSTAALAEQVDNPAYQAWAKYKPGTTVTYTQETSMGGPAAAGGAPEMTVVQKLSDVKPEAVTVDVTATMHMGTMEHQMPPHTMTIPAKIEKDQIGMPQQMPGGEKPEIKDMKEGKETIDVNGKKTETTTRQFTAIMQHPRPMTMHVKTWFAKGVPGGLVKSETNGEGAMQVHSTLVLSEYHVEK